MHQERRYARTCFACPSGRNYLIHTLDAADRAAIMPHLAPVILERKMVLEEADQPVKKVVFPVSGITSMITHGGKGRRIESGLFGCEGMSGMSILTGGVRAPTETIMQVAGEGFSIEVDRLCDLSNRFPSMRRHFLMFLHALLVQISQTALSNRKAGLEERLARWLLMCHDRIDGERLRLTHEVIALMLGVRRAGVTEATHLLEEKGLIRANRGEIVILDRKGLEHKAGSSYGIPEAEYARLFGVDWPAKIYPARTSIASPLHDPGSIGGR